MWLSFSESVEDSSSEVVEVEHSEGSAEDAAVAVVEAFGGTVAGAGDGIVGDFVLPAFEGVAELVECRQAQCAGRNEPIGQAGGTGGSERSSKIAVRLHAGPPVEPDAGTVTLARSAVGVVLPPGFSGFVSQSQRLPLSSRASLSDKSR